MAKLPIPQPIFDTLSQTLAEQKVYTSAHFNEQDFICTLDFLKQYAGNQATFDSYRREVERLIQWSWHVAEKSLLELQRQDLENYIAFCLNPPKLWIATKRAPRFINQEGLRVPNPKWRPFVATLDKSEYKQGIEPTKEQYTLSQKALREVFTVLGSFYQYLLLNGQVTANPIALIRQKSKFLQKRQTQSTVMRLSELQWQTCVSEALRIAEQDPKYERTLFIMSALYLLYLRISELVASDRWVPFMCHFYKDSSERWWFKTVGKGNKLREIAVSDEMLKALKRYRQSLGLTPLPHPNEFIPLLGKEKGSGAITSTRHIRRLVQQCFDQAIIRLQRENLIDEANALGYATVHWLRHTGISDDINKRERPVAHVRDDAGHSSSAITDRYNDIELVERHKTAKYKKLKLPKQSATYSSEP